MPITAASKRNVVDPLSAVVIPVRSGADATGKAACDRTLPIFDGWTRYDIKLSYKEKQEVKTEGYTGPAVVCQARWVPVSGHRANKKSTQFMKDNRDLEMWLVPASGGKVMLPYRIAVKTMRGMLIVQASRLEGVDGGSTQAAN
ncbi:DUF3108 domain-containing protein [Methylobrevis pamukkalensis]|uniref:DUF3108 domain-containing protein n=1 Tax=Methylobrevis pamukkalensis TaxID=1439726 RepID=A0A1E3H0L6_9HYPH|nr:DUF3108 domain-containing protein [Methylobrevis pamukkalensis]ODN69873.1 hypothetical protein A6302_02808 [Methylobrevis pamukkalensis]